MSSRPLVAEFVGTFALALGVALCVAHDSAVTPIVAALTLGMFVYTIGSISGCQINPAVTIGLWSVGKMKSPQALRYIGVQLLAGILALIVTSLLVAHKPMFTMDMSPTVALGELMGAFLLVMGVSSVVYGRVKEDAAGFVIGGSLLLGILVASGFSSGVLNPAVDLALGILSPMYWIGAILGGLCGAQLYAWLMAK